VILPTKIPFSCLSRRTCVLLIVFCIYPSLLAFANGRKEQELKILASFDESRISWQKPTETNDEIKVDGTLTASFGKFAFSCEKQAFTGLASFVYYEVAGSVELDPVRRRLLPLPVTYGKTILFQERFPLLNEPKPFTIIPISIVTTQELFSAFPGMGAPPFSSFAKKPNSITWGKVFYINNSMYLQGNTKGPDGSVNLLFKRKDSGTPELLILQNSGSSELPMTESRLYPWIDEGSGIAFICQERYPLLNQGTISYLWIMATVRASDLLSGFNMIAKQD